MHSIHDSTTAQALGYKLITHVTSDATGRTYQGVQEASRVCVRIKFSPKPSDDVLRDRQRLFTVMQNIPNSRFLALHDYQFVASVNGTQELVTISEWSGTVLAEDIRIHEANRMKYSDGFLIREMRELVNTLSILQERQIAHRNIALDTIYLTTSGLKLIDPKYEFPASRQAIQQQYKADVFDLGIVFLSMALLHPVASDPQHELANCRVSDQVKVMLGRLLEPEEDQRPDFLTLYREFQGVKVRLSLQSVPRVPDEVEHPSVPAEPVMDVRLPGEPSAFRPETKSYKAASESISRLTSDTIDDQSAELSYAIAPSIPKGNESTAGAAVPAASFEESIIPLDPLTHTNSFVSEPSDGTDLDLPPQDYINSMPVASVEEFNIPRLSVQVAPETCMQCGSQKSCSTELKSLLTEFEMPVLLPCNPEAHFFCSRKCFSRYIAEITCQFMIDISFARCKRCNKVLDVGFTEETLGGRKELEREMKQTLTTITKCEYCCQINIPVKKLSCGHDYCVECIEMWAQDSESVNTCKVCQSVIPKTELAQYRKSALTSFIRAVKFW